MASGQNSQDPTDETHSRRDLDRLRLGQAIRALRSTRGLTLTAVAADAGVSTSLLSQVERGLVDPSLDSLRNIADALNTTPFRLLTDGGPIVGLVRRGEGKRLPIGDGEFELLSPSVDGFLQMTWWLLPPGGSNASERRSHRGEEATYLLQGRVRMEVGEEVLFLEVGDCVTIDARIPHRVTSVGDVPAIGLAALSPPSF